MPTVSISATPYHYGSDIATYSNSPRSHKDYRFTYDFENFFHPRVAELIAKLNRDTIKATLDPVFLEGLDAPFFGQFYATDSTSQVVSVSADDKKIDVVPGGAYANYNWELLFHFPVAIAVHLSKNQRFAEARRWFHFVFDPTSTDTSVDPPARYWKFLRFREQPGLQQVDDLLILLSKPDAECTDAELKLKQMVRDGYEYILAHPFQPHGVARTREGAYQLMVVMKYLDNLIAWGDTLFAQDTVETINEATQLYVLAANLLGPRPERVPPVGAVRAKTFDDLQKAQLDAMGNALVDLEAQFPFNVQGSATTPTGTTSSGSLFGIGRTLYFSVPRNTSLLGYWDTVADRLFKIRNSLNLQGIFRQLALFDAPFDPGMLVKAAAAGIDVGSILSGVNQPVGPVRAQLLIQKALELAAEVRGLGGSLLAAIEKGDAEHLGQLRQGHEIELQKLTQDVRFLQWKQAEASTESLLRTRASALERYRYYQRLLGLSNGASVSDTVNLDRSDLTEEGFDAAYATLVSEFDQPPTPQPFPALTLVSSNAPQAQSGASGTGTLALTSHEDEELNNHLPAARDDRRDSSAGDILASVLTFIPEFNIDLHFWGLGGDSKIFGGSKLSDAIRIGAEVLRLLSAWEQDQAGIVARTASYERRADDWTLQNNLAARELAQTGRQIIGSLIAEQVAKHEYNVVKKQIQQAQDVSDFLTSKFTNEELYGWMQGEISRLYYEYYRFAVDTARRAERTMKQELMRPELDATDFIQFNYWDAGRRGLLTGEALYLDVKRMELAYHDNNRRELELTRHISVRQLDPVALLQLRTTGTCEITLPEPLFDRDCPGQYLRRLKSVELSVPSVVGPYTSVNCTLTLLGSSVRTSSIVGDAYARNTQGTDNRFIDYAGAIDSIVASGATNDSGMFETNLHDERFLPFEGAGAISRWRLQLPSAYRAFDYSTISDIVLHVRYTARDGGAVLAAAAVQALTDQLTQATTANLGLLLSARHDFPMEWAAFVNDPNASLTMTLDSDLLPYVTQYYLQSDSTHKVVVDDVIVYAASNGTLAQRTVQSTELNGDLGGNGLTVTLAADATVVSRTGQPCLVVDYHLG